MKSPNFRKKSKKHINKSIAIIGHMGSGKTLIGKLISKELNYRFFDSDKIIEKNTQKSIKNIFENEVQKNRAFSPPEVSLQGTLLIGH